MDKKTEALKLQQKHIKNTVLLSDRYHQLSRLPKNAVVAEVGVLGGDWSQNILAQTTPKELVLIDTFYSKDYGHLKRFDKKSHFNYIQEKFASQNDVVNIKQGLSWEVLSQFPEQYFDWIYIDAAHDYDSVKKDLEQAYRVLKPEGYIVMNDYIMYDHFTNENYGVVQATNEFMLAHDFEMLFFALHPSMFCDVTIRKIND